jgi:hypothetical protein
VVLPGPEPREDRAADDRESPTNCAEKGAWRTHRRLQIASP